MDREERLEEGNSFCATLLTERYWGYKIMFADNLMELRKIHDLSQEELAEKIGVSRQTLSKYETGESLPDIENVKRWPMYSGLQWMI